MELSNALKEYGLSDNEIKVYITLIKTGESTVQNIAKNANLPRTTIYHILESLEQKALVGFIVKESKKYIQEIIPELVSLSGSVKEKPNITVYEGLKGVRSVLKDVLEEKKTIYHYGDIISMQKVFSYAFPQYIKERVKRKISIKILCKKEEPHEELLKTSKKEFREFVFVPKNYEFTSSVFIYSNKVAIFNIKKEPYHVIVIENEDFYHTQKNLFEIIWSSFKHK